MARTELRTGFESNKMIVGPIRSSDKPLAPADRVSKAAEGIFFVQTPTPGAEYEQKEVTSTSENSCCSRGGESGGVRASSFFFGTSSAVMERDESGDKFWVRESNTRDRVGWVRYERYDACKL